MKRDVHRFTCSAHRIFRSECSAGAYDINQQRPPIFLYAFDLLQLNGEDLKSFPWSSGKRALQKRISKPPVKFDISGPWEMTRSRFLKRRENLV
jgi:ATP-dependent DNA ligase